MGMNTLSGSTPDVLTMQRRLLALAQDLQEDVREAGEDRELLVYAAGRAERRLRASTGKRNPSVEILRGFVENARIKDVSEVVGLMDEVGLACAG